MGQVGVSNTSSLWSSFQPGDFSLVDSTTSIMTHRLGVFILQLGVQQQPSSVLPEGQN